MKLKEPSKANLLQKHNFAINMHHILVLFYFIVLLGLRGFLLNFFSYKERATLSDIISGERAFILQFLNILNFNGISSS